MATVEELRDKAKELDIEGRSTMNKDELEKAVADAEGSSGDQVADGSAPANESEASDLDNPLVREGLSSQGQEAADEMDAKGLDASKDEADAALDASGPLHLEAPSDRIMTGAVSEEQAKEQRKVLKDASDDDHTGNYTEAGEPLTSGVEARAKEVGSKKENLGKGDDREVYTIEQEDVIDFPPPVGQREGTFARTHVRDSDQKEDRNPELAYAEPGGTPVGNAVVGAGSRSGDVYSQKSVLYTDGLSGGADHNLERAYEIPEVLQSSNPEEREAGDESVSEAAQDAQSDKDKARADAVKNSSNE